MLWAAPLTARAATGCNRSVGCSIPDSLLLHVYPSKTRCEVASMVALQHSLPHKQLNACPFPSLEFKIEKSESNAFSHNISKCNKAFFCTAAKESTSGFPLGQDVTRIALRPVWPPATCRQRSRRGTRPACAQCWRFINWLLNREIHSTTTAFYSQRRSAERR